MNNTRWEYLIVERDSKKKDIFTKLLMDILMGVGDGLSDVVLENKNIEKKDLDIIAYRMMSGKMNLVDFLGMDGWELVSVVSSDRNVNTEMYFKRPMEFNCIIEWIKYKELIKESEQKLNDLTKSKYSHSNKESNTFM